MSDSSSGSTPSADSTSSPPSSTHGQPTPGYQSIRNIKARFYYSVGFVAGMFVLTMIGLYMMDAYPTNAFYYWSAMFPIFGLISIWQSINGKPGQQGVLRHVAREVAHWAIPIPMVALVFFQLNRGQMAGQSAGVAILLLLTLTCFLAGIHFTPNFVWIGLLLGFGVILDTYLEESIFVIVPLGLVALAGIIGGMYLYYRRGEHTH